MADNSVNHSKPGNNLQRKEAKEVVLKALERSQTVPRENQEKRKKRQKARLYCLKLRFSLLTQDVLSAGCRLIIMTIAALSCLSLNQEESGTKLEETGTNLL